MKKDTDPVRSQIDGLLAEIGAKKNAITSLEKSMALEIERVTASLKPGILAAEDALKAIEVELLGLMKYHKAALFDGTDRVDLRHGAVLRQMQRKVKRIKGMLQRLKALGEQAAIKVVESVDWDQIEKWDDECLKTVGTRRVSKEIFVYEVKGVK